MIALALAAGGCAGEVSEPLVPGNTTGAAPGTTAGAPAFPAGATTGAPVAATDGGMMGRPGTNGMDAPSVDAGPPSPPDVPSCDGVDPPAAANVTLDEVAIYQGVKVPLMEGGVAVTSRNAPVIQGREALVRAFVRPGPGYSPHQLVGILRLDNGGVVKGYSAMLSPSSPSQDASLSSTFNFEVDGDDIGPSTQISLSLHEADCGATAGTGARFPTSGLSSLSAVDTGVLKVKLVPIRYTGGGSSVTADASAGVVERMRETLLKLYPVRDVVLTVREPYTWSSQVAPSGGGWSQLLNAIMSLRDAEGGPDEYFYGLVAAAPTFRQYCGYGCVAGIAPVGMDYGGWGGGARPQAGIGVGFDDQNSRDTAAHELGHTHGSGHAPCGANQGIDNDYPYSGAQIGSWGYDILDGTLKIPSGAGGHVDIMSYCDPTWISDYTFAKWADWSQKINSAARIVPAPDAPSSWQSLILDASGVVQWGTWAPSAAPSGRHETATVRDASGALLDEVEVVRMELDHDSGEFVFLPDAEDDWATLELSDRTVDLTAAAPAAH